MVEAAQRLILALLSAFCSNLFLAFSGESVSLLPQKQEEEINRSDIFQVEPAPVNAVHSAMGIFFHCHFRHKTGLNVLHVLFEFAEGIMSLLSIIPDPGRCVLCCTAVSCKCLSTCLIHFCC